MEVLLMMLVGREEMAPFGSVIRHVYVYPLVCK